ncbi:helix-turn-helix domain-containing protein [Pacificibacter marinus]|uniref:Helix-turn-helix domain protein n=1 Tax=Pacificibacter marinus TaxID=658057 RepID=A0A1Y5TP93_9RHOB|nr:XRE family transcriptional regulator [Pacificibacter marinus]SEL28761.1 Zn-dependent peptidase ImmA, M78 family [Pacificibacter marinus]SLN66756.1 Helix-turn-helix domain protein [Pacificibacter marinus]
MRIGTPGFVPARLTEARAARRIPSMTELARMLGVTSSKVSRWESGEHSPEPDALTDLARELRVRREFFLRPVFDSTRPFFHRKLASASKRDRTYQHAQVNWLNEVSSIAQHYVDLPELDIPDLMTSTHFKQLRDSDIEGFAMSLREHWGLGDGPCIDVVGLLERVGCVVSSIEMGTSKLDGVCSWSEIDQRPHILLANDKMSLPRRQMDAAHELGHAILHKNVTESELKSDLKEIERQAFRFASAFLMPETSYIRDLPNFSLAGMLTVKERWRVSIKAQISRLRSLGLIDSDDATRMYKTYSAKGWSRVEPLDREWKLPQPQLLKDAFQLIVDSGTRTKEDLLAVEFTLHRGDIENLANLPSGWFLKDPSPVIELALRKTHDKPAAGGMTGQIISFSNRPDKD